MLQQIIGHFENDRLIVKNNADEEFGWFNKGEEWILNSNFTGAGTGGYLSLEQVYEILNTNQD